MAKSFMEIFNGKLKFKLPSLMFTIGCDWSDEFLCYNDTFFLLFAE